MDCVIECFDGQLVTVDAEDFQWANEEQWRWHGSGKQNGGAYRVEPDTSTDRRVYLHREIMGEPDGLWIGFLDKNRYNCCRRNLFLFRKGERKLAAARARAGVCGEGTHNPPFGEKYETLGCVCGTLTRIEVVSRTKRCCECRRRLSDDSL